jgi:IS30 family transposase
VAANSGRDNYRAVEVSKAMKSAIAGLSEELMCSITWDQHEKLSSHHQFSVDAGVAVYFCDPRCHGLCGSNENRNGLLRRYMTKGTDLGAHRRRTWTAFLAVSRTDRAKRSDS